jgi:hypothetical protein
MVTRILEHEFESFRDLQKLFFESSSDTFEGNKIVSAPENFDDEIFRTISNKVKFQKSPTRPLDNDSDRWPKQTSLLNPKTFSNMNTDFGKKISTSLYSDELNGPTGGRYQERAKTDHSSRDYLQDIEANKAWIRDKLITKTPPRISALNNSVQRDTHERTLGDSRFNQSVVSDRFMPSATSKFLAKSEAQNEFKTPLSNNYLGINRNTAERENRIQITEAVRSDIMASRKINPLIPRQLDNSHINVSVPNEQFTSPIKNKFSTEPNFYKQPIQNLGPQREPERETVNVSRILERLDTQTNLSSKLRGQTSTEKLIPKERDGKENEPSGAGANDTETGNKRQLKLEREILYNSKYLQKNEKLESSVEQRSSPREAKNERSPWKFDRKEQDSKVLDNEYRTTNG